MPPPITFTATIHRRVSEERGEVGPRGALVTTWRNCGRDDETSAGGWSKVVRSRIEFTRTSWRLAFGVFAALRLRLAAVDLLEAFLADRGRDVGGVGAQPARGRHR